MASVVPRLRMCASLQAVRMLHASALSRSNYDEVVQLRRKYLSPSLLTFEAYDKPLVLVKGEMQYMWDSEGNKYIDLLGQNLCISVGHCHPKVVKAAVDQLQKLPHCTTMYYHEEPAKLAKELVDRMPPHPSGDDWVVHLVNDGSEAVDLAIQMARVYTARPEVIALHKVSRRVASVVLLRFPVSHSLPLCALLFFAAVVVLCST